MKMNRVVYILGVLMMLFFSCGDSTSEPEVVKSSLKKILSFQLKTDGNEGLNETYDFNIDGVNHEISVTLPKGIDLTNLCPEFSISNKAELFVGKELQISGESRHNFTSPVTYKIVAEDGTSINYDVVIYIEKSKANSIVSFVFKSDKNKTLSEDFTCQVNDADKTITGKLPYGTDVASLVPDFEISEYAKLSFNNTVLEKGVSVIDLSSYIDGECNLSVEAESGDLKTYTLKLSIEKIQSVNLPDQILLSDALGIFDISLEGEGEAKVSSLGLCWSKESEPTVDDNCQEKETIKTYRFRLNNLQSNTEYHIRAFAKSDKGIVYSDELVVNTLNEGELPKFVKPLVNNEWEAHAWPYNAYNPEDNDGVESYYKRRMYNGHYTNACGPTAFAKALYAVRYPVSHMTGNLDYVMGGMHFKCNGDELELDYDDMPRILEQTSTKEEYDEVAKLIQYTTVLGEYYWDMGNGYAGGVIGGINMENDGVFMCKMRKFLKTTDDFKVVNRWEYTREEWIKIFKTELAAGRTIIIAGRTEDSPAPDEDGNVSGHWFNVEGYNEKGEFFVTFNLHETQEYKDIDDFGRFKAYNQAFIGLIPKP